MATQSDEGTASIVHETDENDVVIDRVRKLNEAVQGKDQIIGRRFIEIVADVATNVDQLMNEENRPYNVERLNAFSCLASCFAFVKSSTCYIQDLETHVDLQERNSRFKRIQSVIKDVTAKLEEAENYIKELKNLVVKMAEHKYSQESESMVFDVKFDLAVDALDSCASGIIYAKKELECEFASLKIYLELRRRQTFKGAGAVLSVGGVIAGIVKSLVPIIGTSYDYGIHVALIGNIGALGYMSYKLWKDFKYHDLMAQYEDCKSQIENLDRQMRLCNNTLHDGAIGNAKRVKNLRACNENLTDENTDLKEKNEHLEEEIERFKKKAKLSKKE